MANVKMFKLLGVILALALIVWAILPFVSHKPITNDVLATSIILILIAVAYLIILYNPSWTKAVFFFEGIVIGVSGYMLLDYPYLLLPRMLGPSKRLPARRPCEDRLRRVLQLQAAFGNQHSLHRHGN